MPRKIKLNPSFPAAIYARYSSHAQNDASIEQQIDACTEFAKHYDLTIAHTYEDRAVSGRTDKRTGFQKMMRDAQLGAFRYLIAWKSNRIGRNMLEAMTHDAELKELGIRCLYVEEDFDDSASGRFNLRTMMNVNQFYSEAMAEDIRRGLENNAKQFKANGKVPLGYRRNPDTGFYEIDEEKAEVVREIFERVFTGHQYAEIAKDLNERRITTSKGQPWGKNSFSALLTNERYIGTYIYGEYRQEDAIPAIIGKELFYAVQNRVNRKKHCTGRNRNDVIYLLTGKLFCGLCGTQMTGMSAFNRNNEPYYYYACHKKRVERACNKKNVRKEDIEYQITVAIQCSMLTDENIEWMADQVMKFQAENPEFTQATYYREKLAEVQRTLANIMKAIEAGIFNDTTAKRMRDLEQEQLTLRAKARAEEAKLPKVTREQVIETFEHYREGDPRDKTFQRQMIDHFVYAVYLYDDHFKIITNYTGDNNTFDVPITLDDLGSEKGAVCSLNACNAPPLQGKANTIRFIRGVFVFTFYIDIE